VRRADRIVALVLLGGAVAFSAVALQFPYRGPNGPGSGFLPFWLGVAMTVLAVLLLVQAGRAPDARWVPDRVGLVRLVAVVASTLLFVALLPVVGMIPGTALFLIGLLRFLERYAWPTAIGVGVGAAGANYVLFVRWLQVPFPQGWLGF